MGKHEARHAKIREIEPEEAQLFFALVNPQGATTANTKTLSLGMFIEGALFGVMQFCTPRTAEMKEKYSFELLQLSFTDDIEPLDGAFMLIQHFIKTYKPADFFAHRATQDETISSIHETFGMKFSTQDDSGDFIYEWIDPNRTYYVYRVTATDSNKYYYGVSHLKKADATIEECLNDGYYGSGGKKETNKFKNWKKKHFNSIKKEVLELFTISRKAYEMEKKLIGTAWKDDPLCLNSTTGGKFGGILPNSSRFKLDVCLVHGESKFDGEQCIKCRMRKSWSIGFCPRHGETSLQAGKCAKCKSASSFRVDDCPKHGSTTFSGRSCRKCVADMSDYKICDTHGRTLFIKDSCYKCFRYQPEFRECSIHGESLHKLDLCMKCKSAERLSSSSCKIHGETTFLDEQCAKCSAAERESLKVCKIHGMVSHTGNSCRTCTSRNALSEKECATHGLSKHRGDKCYKCIQAKTTHTRYHTKKSIINPDCILCN